jgi:hypothetical protein
MGSISKLKDNDPLQASVMKNIQSKTRCSLETQYFVIFMVQSERQIKERMLCASLFIAFMITRR